MMNYDFPLAYACFNNDLDVRLNSTSGGIFTLIASYIIEKKNGLVYGAAFNEKFEVFHYCVSSVEELWLLRGSKYPQSYIDNSYNEIKEILEDGKCVLFTGTPCQVVALKDFLDKDYDNLYCLDFICHGVASDLIWEKYVSKLKRKGDIKAITFKSKPYGWKRWYFRVQYDNKIFQQRGSMNEFMRSYLQYCNIRPSCFECPFKGLKHISDFTISDCWGIGEHDREINDDKGLSALLIQNERGLKIFTELKEKMTYKEYEANALMKGNWTTFESVLPNKNRCNFFTTCHKYGAEIAMKEYFKPSIKDWIYYFIKKLEGIEK